MDGKSIVVTTPPTKKLSNNRCSKKDTQMHTQRMGEGKVSIFAQIWLSILSY
jgi:hypothetical protein